MDQQPSPAPETPESEPTPEERQEHTDYLKNIVQPKPAKKGWPKWPLLIAVIIIIGVAGVYLAGHHSPTKPAAKTTTIAKVAPTQTSTSTSTSNYVSNGKDLNLSFDYPASWTATPVTGGNTTDQPISVTSPLVSMTSAAGQGVTGKVVLQIRPVTAQLNELGSGTTAAQASIQYAYSKPTPAQHNYFYLTFVHVSGASNPAGSFQEIFVTGINTFSAGDSLTPSSISVDPIISASFYSCAASICTGASAVPLSISNTTWQNADIFKQTLTALESLKLN